MDKNKLFILVLPIFYFLTIGFTQDYVVQKNDTLWSISKKIGIEKEIIAKINNVSENRLKVGQKLSIPDRIVQYTVKNRDYLNKIAHEYNSKVEFIILYNNLANENIYPGMKLKIPVIKKNIVVQKDEKKELKDYNKSTLYEVKKGDTLTSISKEFNTSINSILEYNQKKNNNLFIGEKLNILTDKVEVEKKKSVQNKNNIEPNQKPTDKISLEDGFCFPVNRQLIKYISRTSRGITIFLISPTDVISINSGIVEYTGRMKGYNNVVIVKYGSDQRAVYGFLDQIKVTRGCIVTNKQVIGNLKHISFLGQIELYFEMRNGKEAIDIFEIYPFIKKEDYLAKK